MFQYIKFACGQYSTLTGFYRESARVNSNMYVTN